MLEPTHIKPNELMFYFEEFLDFKGVNKSFTFYKTYTNIRHLYEYLTLTFSFNLVCKLINVSLCLFWKERIFLCLLFQLIIILYINGLDITFCGARLCIIIVVTYFDLTSR